MPSTETIDIPDTHYFRAVGRRKSASARVRLYEDPKEETIVVNNQVYTNYFPTEEMHKIIESALEEAEVTDPFFVSVRVSGSGLHSQAEAIRLGIARALVEFNETNRANLKKAGYLKRDPRAKERKKFGKKKARKSAQWSKR